MAKRRYGYFSLLLALCLAVSACTLTGQSRAPIVDAGTAAGNIPAGGTAPATGQAVYYTVQAGDSLGRIAAQYGQSWQDIATWNNLSDPNVLSVGQVLLVVPAGGSAPVAVTNPDGNVQTPPGSGSGTIQPAGNSVADRMQWSWPAKGAVIANYNGTTNKGIDIGGNAGDPVYAAADGRVAYVGDGLRGYGNLVIIKHNDVFVTAYAHNQRIMVEENQVVRRGEQIAEMGSSDAPRVMLHFEVRQQSQEGGSPVDPMRYLPAR